MGVLIDITGKRFGILTAVSLDCVDKGGNAKWNWVCDCGKTGASRLSDLKLKTSCGCVRREAQKAKRVVKQAEKRKNLSAACKQARSEPHISAEDISKFVLYDHLTGNFYNKLDRGSIKKGDRLGCKAPHGYVLLSINYRRYYAHRIAWICFYGSIPADGMTIDHINGVRDDNRIENLRLVSIGDNNKNRNTPRKNTKSGILGAQWNNQRQCWQSSFHGKRLGSYATPEEAGAAYKEAKAKYEQSKRNEK